MQKKKESEVQNTKKVEDIRRENVIVQKKEMYLKRMLIFDKIRPKSFPVIY